VRPSVFLSTQFGLALDYEKLSAFILTLAIVAFCFWQQRNDPHKEMLPRNEFPTEQEKNWSESSASRALGFRGKKMANSKLNRLIDKREAVNARIKLEQNKLRSDERKNDTRRKILAGATVLEWAKRDSEFSSRLMAELKRFLVRDADRAAFGLPPIQNRKDSNAA
jgi:hypothetical protein